ncbi:MAG: flagellar biosynthesis anti-sigma factor FlgM [Acidobacteriaceae bacterium]|nr:flagellar biosynthesis anti-sigma factor FlgM [Acidobacteriaceae bacterium]
MRISETPSPDSAAVQPASGPAAAKEAEQSIEPGGPTADQANVGAVALAASKSLDTSESKVAELRQQFIDGTYRVDSRALSARIIEDHLDK